MKQPANLWRPVILGAFLIFMVVPVIATLIFSVSTRWDRTLWPEGYTLKWWIDVTSRPLFVLSLRNSFIASLATMLCLLVW